MVELEGLRAQLEDETLILFISGGDGEDKLVAPALELAEALARLEEPPLIFMTGVSDESEDMAQEPVAEERLPAPWQPPFPDKEPLEEGYRAAEVALIEPPGVLLLRRVFSEAEDVLELDTPLGSVYQFPYPQALEYLRRFLPR